MKCVVLKDKAINQVLKWMVNIVCVMVLLNIIF